MPIWGRRQWTWLHLEMHCCCFHCDLQSRFSQAVRTSVDTQFRWSQLSTNRKLSLCSKKKKKNGWWSRASYLICSQACHHVFICLSLYLFSLNLRQLWLLFFLAWQAIQYLLNGKNDRDEKETHCLQEHSSECYWEVHLYFHCPEQFSGYSVSFLWGRISLKTSWSWN